ncbi:NAD-dependent epimerase/dehydratase family protein [Brevundimonas bacteroides]|uniref:NAD-dependent epimerase/dehydratase family protein n=1 Tax=Brevundimonas bacteroides TaxID=74311 RepID=UPI000495216A|nr:NAD-dependent epimerase/dehydratase family protein [Brevundimonas bacteroides]
MTDARSAWGRTALIGATGFVGGVLSREVTFDASYASANIDSIVGESFDTVICAGAPAAMWRANADPEGDLDNLGRLVDAVSQARINQLVLISTIAVLADPAAGADESTTDFETDHPYGCHRRWLETALVDQFPTLILRMPALFGPGLKKNFLFDLRHPVPAFLKPDGFVSLSERLSIEMARTLSAVYAADAATGLITLNRPALAGHPDGAALTEAVVAAGFAATGFTHPDSRFQFYDLGGLAQDISIALDLHLDVLHLAVEPWHAGNLSRELIDHPLEISTAPLRIEDMRTRHASSFGGTGPYLRSREQVLTAIRRDWDTGAW